MIYKFKTKVQKVERMQKLAKAWHDGEEIKTEYQDLGWYVLLEGSNECLHVGMEKPELEVGQSVTVAIVPE